MKEQQQRSETQLFNCSKCDCKAHNPVLSPCGHLFCWSCFYTQNKLSKKCLVCEELCQITNVYPIFIDHQSMQQYHNEDIPQRPLPIHQQKILNSNMIGGGLPMASVLLKNNIIMGRLISGNSFSPSLAVNLLSQMGDPQQRDIQKPIYLKLKLILILMLSLLMIAYILFLIF